MHVLGIDAGGTKTVCYLADSAGALIGEGRGSGANLQSHGELEVEKVLHAVIDAAIGDRVVRPAAVCLGIAGVDRADDDLVVRGILRRLGFRERTLVVNDALIALIAGVGHAAGVVVIAGTGSIAYGVNGHGQAARAGGWGPILGDEGSGAWIGQRALTAVVREADGRGPRTRLTPLVLEHFGITHPAGLVREIYDRPLRRERLATLAVLAERARAEGDIVAGEILRVAAEELARAAGSVIERLHMRGDDFRAVLAGGMFKALPSLTGEVQQHVAELAPRAVSARLDAEPALGAVWLARQALEGGVTVPQYLDPAGIGRS